MKTCSRCLIEKNLEDFYSSTRHKDKLYSICKSCCQAKARDRYREDPTKMKLAQKKYLEANPDSRRNTMLKNQRGITLNDYQIMFQAQEGKCAICKTDQKDMKKALNVDHCHKTGKIRGLLCGKCNQALGLLQDKVEVIETAASYLRRSNEGHQ